MTATRERVVFPKNWTFDLAEEMVEAIGEEFSPQRAVEELARQIAGKPADEAEEIARAYFADYGQRWMGRSLELGEKYADRTYEVLKQVVASTGELGFPCIPERFIEIAYLSTQPLYSLPIAENTRHAFSFKMVFCDTHRELEAQCGEGLAKALPCAEGCLAACRLAFSAHGYDVEVTQDASLAEGEFCQFTARPRTERARA